MMKNKLFLSLTLLLIYFSMANSENRINITIDGRTMSATLADNVATQSLVEKLVTGPITITMNNYGGFEKVGALPWSLPTADTHISTQPGDIMLYNNNNIVIFYGQNSWAYTRLGVLESTNPEEISSFVGNGEKKVTISLANQSQINNVSVEAETREKVIALDGKEVTNRPLKPGIYIVNGKKTIIK